MNIFLKILKIKSVPVFSVYALMVFNFCCLVKEKLKDMVLACFCEKKTYELWKILSVTLFKMLVAAFRKQPVIL
jgi:hypothetical protein